MESWSNFIIFIIVVVVVVVVVSQNTVRAAETRLTLKIIFLKEYLSCVLCFQRSESGNF
jgi:hypothetical protein